MYLKYQTRICLPHLYKTSRLEQITFLLLRSLVFSLPRHFESPISNIFSCYILMNFVMIIYQLKFLPWELKVSCLRINELKSEVSEKKKEKQVTIERCHYKIMEFTINCWVVESVMKIYNVCIY